MSNQKIDAIIFSGHKLGLLPGTGFLIVVPERCKKNYYNSKFVPLIAGQQNRGLRGGTFNMRAYTELRESDYSLSHYKTNKRMIKWKKLMDRLTMAGIETSIPEKHVYSTIAIPTKRCANSVVKQLHMENIHINTGTACMNESGNDRYNIRLSLDHSTDLEEESVDRLVSAIKNVI